MHAQTVCTNQALFPIPTASPRLGKKPGMGQKDAHIGDEALSKRSIESSFEREPTAMPAEIAGEVKVLAGGFAVVMVADVCSVQ